MKKLIAFTFGIVALLGACGPNDDDSTPSNNPNNPPAAGSWRVTWFWDKDKEETSDFSGHSFEFQSNGALVATTAAGTYSGTWAKNSSGSKLTIAITGTYALDEMSDDWLIDEMTSSSIKLRDDNDEHLEELHLELE